jgi:hypothetical protein
MPDILSTVRDYIALGWAPVPIPHRQKGPLLDAWQDLRVNAETAVAYFNGAKQNIGVILGKASGGLTDVDLDCPEAIAAAGYILPRTAVFGHASKPASHWVYRTNLSETQDRAAIKFMGSDKVGLLEVRMGAGGMAAQTVFPPSTHVSGEPIEWADRGPGEIAEIDGAELVIGARRLAAAAELARNYPKVGGRHDAAFVLGGFLARCGLSPSQAATFVEAVGAASLQPGEKRRDMARTARSGAEAGKRAGFPALAETFGKGAAKKVADWLGYKGERDGDEHGPRPFAPIEGDAGAEPIKFTPTPFKWREPSTFPRRQFVYGRHYARQYLSVTVAPTKVGKSSLDLVEAVAMASGRNLLGVEPVRPMRVWYWNGEDPQEELERRVLAICLYYGIKRGELEETLFLDSGRDTEIIVATQAKTGGAVIATPVEDALTSALIEGKFDVLTLDPAVSVHRVSENDNMAIDAVAKTFGRISGNANAAIETVHHTRKLGGQEATTEDSRGASSYTAAARDVRALNRMTKDEGAKAGIEEGKERLYFKVDTDGNHSPASTTEWFNLASQGLGNGSGGPIDDQDYVGVVVPWKLPDAFEGVTVADLRTVQAAIRVGRWRENSRAKDWAGPSLAP